MKTQPKPPVAIKSQRGKMLGRRHAPENAAMTEVEETAVIMTLETTTTEVLVMEEMQKVMHSLCYSFPKSVNNSYLSSSGVFLRCLSEVDIDKKSNDAEVEEVHNEVAKNDAENWTKSSRQEVNKVFFWLKAYTCKYFHLISRHYASGRLECTAICKPALSTLSYSVRFR